MPRHTFPLDHRGLRMGRGLSHVVRGGQPLVPESDEGITQLARSHGVTLERTSQGLAITGGSEAQIQAFKNATNYGKRGFKVVASKGQGQDQGQGQGLPFPLGPEQGHGHGGHGLPFAMGLGQGLEGVSDAMLHWAIQASMADQGGGEGGAVGTGSRPLRSS